MNVNLNIIHGMVITDIEFRVLIGSRFVNLWEKFKETSTFEEFWKSSNCKAELEKKLRVSIFTWSQGSDLYLKKFILGERLCEFTDVLDTLCELPKVSSDLTDNIRCKLRRFALEHNIETILVVN